MVNKSPVLYHYPHRASYNPIILNLVSNNLYKSFNALVLKCIYLEISSFPLLMELADSISQKYNPFLREEISTFSESGVA